jgi:hypothetical protein
MQYVVDESLTNFKFWSGAADNAKLLEYSELQELDDVLPEYFNTGDGNLPTATEINDMFWFDFATVCEAIGLQYDEEKGEIIRDNDESRKKRSEANGNDKVGKQNFTYAELEDAWNKLNARIQRDPFDKDNPPSGGYDIRNGYACGERDWNDWHIDFSLDAVKKALEEVAEPIKEGDLEVYYNDKDNNQADSDNHGIFIIDGKIDTIY